MVGLGQGRDRSTALKVPIYTYYAAGPTASPVHSAKDGEDRIRLKLVIPRWQLNPPVASDRSAAPLMTKRFKVAVPGFGNIGQSRGLPTSLAMLARSHHRRPAVPADDVVAVASASWKVWSTTAIWGGKISMRPQDHQAIQNVHIMAHTANDVTFDFDNSGFGLKVESTVEMAAADSATSCKMKRPKRCH